eukprot:1161933-Pelagomonas_calceolata.AAC.3
MRLERASCFVSFVSRAAMKQKSLERDVCLIPVALEQNSFGLKVLAAVSHSMMPLAKLHSNLTHLVLVDDLPAAGGCGVGRHTLKDHACHAIEEGAFRDALFAARPPFGEASIFMTRMQHRTDAEQH